MTKKNKLVVLKEDLYPEARVKTPTQFKEENIKSISNIDRFIELRDSNQQIYQDGNEDFEDGLFDFFDYPATEACHDFEVLRFNRNGKIFTITIFELLEHSWAYDHSNQVSDERTLINGLNIPIVMLQRVITEGGDGITTIIIDLRDEKAKISLIDEQHSYVHGIFSCSNDTIVIKAKHYRNDGDSFFFELKNETIQDIDLDEVDLTLAKEIKEMAENIMNPWQD